MAVGEEPWGYRLARVARKRGWTLDWSARHFDFDYSYGEAVRIYGQNGELVWGLAVRQTFKVPRKSVPLTLKIAMRAKLARLVLTSTIMRPLLA